MQINAFMSLYNIQSWGLNEATFTTELKSNRIHLNKLEIDLNGGYLNWLTIAKFD